MQGKQDEISERVIMFRSWFEGRRLLGRCSKVPSSLLPGSRSQRLVPISRLPLDASGITLAVFSASALPEELVTRANPRP